MTDDRFRVLFVCHANICRSPMAERLAELVFRRQFGPHEGSIAFASAGTHARPGQAMHPHSARVLHECGADDTGFASRTATTELISAAGLVLTASRIERAHCASLAPASVRRIMTLREFSRLAAAVDATELATPDPVGLRLRELIDQALLARARVRAASAADDELADPVNGPLEAFEECAAQIRVMLETIAGRLDPSRAAASA